MGGNALTGLLVEALRLEDVVHPVLEVGHPSRVRLDADDLELRVTREDGAQTAYFRSPETVAALVGAPLFVRIAMRRAAGHG